MFHAKYQQLSYTHVLRLNKRKIDFNNALLHVPAKKLTINAWQLETFVLFT